MFTEVNNGVSKFDVKKILDNQEKDFLLMICGASGSGKSWFEKSLINDYPDYFFKLPQITTRSPREGETNEYFFLSKYTYLYLKDRLIGRLENFNGNSYGTLPVFRKGKINTIVVSTDAIKDIMNLLDVGELDVNVGLLMLDISNDNITEDGIRADRDMSFVDKERLDLKTIYEQLNIDKISYSFDTYGRFAKPEDIFVF